MLEPTQENNLVGHQAVKFFYSLTQIQPRCGGEKPCEAPGNLGVQELAYIGQKPSCGPHDHEIELQLAPQMWMNYFYSHLLTIQPTMVHLQMRSLFCQRQI